MQPPGGHTARRCSVKAPIQLRGGHFPTVVLRNCGEFIQVLLYYVL